MARPGSTPVAPLLAIGVDGAPAGWAAACLYADAPTCADASVWDTRLQLCSTIDDVADVREQQGGDAAVAIDVPIGLPDTARYRPCDNAARNILKRLGRESSVFAPPGRYMLEAAGDYPAIRALDTWVRAHSDCRAWLVECHPKLSWYALSDGERLLDKRSGSGLVRRLQLLRDVFFPDAEARIAAAPWSGKQATLSDLLDAYAALSSAVAFARGPDEHEELGDGEHDSEGLPMRMVM